MSDILQQSSAGTASDSRHNEAWARFLARIVDATLLWPVLLLLGFLIGWTAMSISPDAEAAVIGTASDRATAWLFEAGLLVLCTLLYEAVLIGRFGTTPGKRLLGLRVRTDAGESPGFAAAGKRTALVLVLGLGLFIPILTAITRAIAYVRFVERGRAPWDAAAGLQVEKRPVAAWRWAIGFAAWALTIALSLYDRVAGLPAT
jgi:uncharacterized RDD family membrane protein YckC